MAPPLKTSAYKDDQVARVVGDEDSILIKTKCGCCGRRITLIGRTVHTRNCACEESAFSCLKCGRCWPEHCRCLKTPLPKGLQHHG